MSNIFWAVLCFCLSFLGGFLCASGDTIGLILGGLCVTGVVWILVR